MLLVIGCSVVFGGAVSAGSADSSDFVEVALLGGVSVDSDGLDSSLFVVSADVTGCWFVFGDDGISTYSFDFDEVALLGFSVDSDALDSSLFVVFESLLGGSDFFFIWIFYCWWFCSWHFYLCFELLVSRFQLLSVWHRLASAFPPKLASDSPFLIESQHVWLSQSVPCRCCFPIQGVEEDVVLDMAIRTHRVLKRLVSFVKSAFGLILCPYQMARSLSSAVQVSVNNSIQLSSMPRFRMPPLLNGMSLLKLSKLDCTIRHLFSCQMQPRWLVAVVIEIYLPPYLFQPNGDRAIRPVKLHLSRQNNQVWRYDAGEF